MLKAIFTNSSGILLSRITGFFRDLMMAFCVGANIYSDVFFVAFKLPNLFRRIFAEGAFAQVFLPSFSKSKYKGHFGLSIFVKFSSFIFLLSLIVMIFPQEITKILAFGFDKDAINLASQLLQITFWYLQLIFIVVFLSSILQYKGHFSTTAYSTALLNISMILALWLSIGFDKFDIVYYLSISVIAGGIMQTILHLWASYKLKVLSLLYVGYKKRHLHKIDNKAAQKNFNKQFFPAIIGASTPQISAFLDTFLASFLISGALSHIYYANRIFQLPLALFAIATSVAIFPYILKKIKSNDTQKARDILKNCFWILFALLLGSCIGGIMLQQEIIWLLFERGEFDTQDTKQTAKILEAYLLGLVPFGLQKIFSLWLFAHNKQAQIAKISIMSICANITFAMIFIIPLKAYGLALASSIGGFCLFMLTIKAYGLKEFWDIIYSKKVFFVALFIFVEIISIIFFKNIFVSTKL